MARLVISDGIVGEGTRMDWGTVRLGAHTCTRAYANTHTYMHTYRHMHTCTNTYTHMHTHTHTYAHTMVLLQRWGRELNCYPGWGGALWQSNCLQVPHSPVSHQNKFSASPSCNWVEWYLRSLTGAGVNRHFFTSPQEKTPNRGLPVSSPESLPTRSPRTAPMRSMGCGKELTLDDLRYIHPLLLVTL